ncbi:hypothetical protein COLO4_34580 [Corchorus olitorius]|uniref:Uncharacterized protein n=1 Tax=Corchorus olitorius TaxID=93759 RepID=A0A1R3GK82_9ROSI|nr:hypothetical protein COLO4_34580 [Corchorus olitorius]
MMLNLGPLRAGVILIASAHLPPPRGLTEDGSRLNGSLMVELLLMRLLLRLKMQNQSPFQEQASSRLDALLEVKAKQGVQ